MVAVSGGGPEPVPALAAEVPATTIDDGRRRGSSIDVVVVRRRDGSLACTAFVVRFEPPTTERLSRGLSAAYASLERGVARLRSDDRPLRDGFDEDGDDLCDDDAADGDARPVRVAVNGAAVDCDLVAGADGRCRFAGGSRPGAAALERWGLRPGSNALTFEFGRQVAEARAFLWDAGDRVVVCDVDGTITASDVRGFLDSTMSAAPSFAHGGVCAFLGGVVAPRARVLYLTSRPVALAASTRAFLASLRQGRDGLPDGPLVTSGEGLLGAVYAEVVAKTPDVFKTRALLDLAAAFGGDPGASPVVLGFGPRGTQTASRVEDSSSTTGFGNRDTDARAYARAGVADDRNFSIDARSRLTSRCGTLGFAGYDDAGLARAVAPRSVAGPPAAAPARLARARGARPPRPDLAGFLSGALGGNDGAVDIYVQEKARPRRARVAAAEPPLAAAQARGRGRELASAWQPPAWWAAATAPLAAPLGIERNDGVRLRLGKESDADAIRALWAENDETRVAGPHSLAPAWSAAGIKRAFAPRREAGAFRATSVVAYDWSNLPPALVGFAAANSPDEPYNREAVGLPWRNAAPPGFDPTAFVGPVCVAAPKRGSGLFRDLYAGLFADLAPERAAVTVIDARNAPSLRAHEKVPGCERRGAFDAGGREWVVFSFDLDAARRGLAPPPP
ncbi:phosphatidate phosphatase [Aureococcus anophagefferens]|uniref:Phosphatidate phosphatase n=1 Tax=Aureococcus anophagefferens TaxID=44056 RepID=A0ABR1G2Q1_AURAN